MKKRVILIFILFSFIGKGLDYFINDADKTHSQMLWSFLFLSHLGRSEYKRRQNIYFSMCTKQKVRLNNQFKSFFLQLENVLLFAVFVNLQAFNDYFMLY